jgi:arylsulfatase A
LTLYGFPLVVFAAETSEKDQSVSKSLPNFVLIVIDDLGYGDIGIYGNKIHHTPNIDKLAKKVCC